MSPPSQGVDLNNDTDAGDPLRFRLLGDLYATLWEDVEEPVVGELLVAVGDGEPATFEDAKQEQCWLKAMREEMASIEQNNTWRLVDLPCGHKAIGLKWVFKLKRDEAGVVVKHKARLVAKGYVQQQGVDCGEVFALVARMESIRLLLAVAAQEGWSVHHMDVKSAFLNGELEEEVYVQQPPGFTAAGHEGKVLKLIMALYGLRQAPRAWNVKLDSSLRDMEFTRCESEYGMYTRGLAASRVVVGVYVDDLIITGANSVLVKEFKREMQQVFRMSDLGLLSFYLGIEVKQRRGAITLGQAAYARKLLEKAGMGSSNPCQTPMEVRLQLSTEGTSKEVDATMYRSLVGSLRYLVHTRPDISFAVGYVSRFMERPRVEHLAAVKHLLRYIAGTVDYGIVYSKLAGGNNKLLGYTDSDFGVTLMIGRAQVG